MTPPTINWQDHWIPCRERLPKAEQWVIVSDNHGNVFEAYIRNDLWNSWSGGTPCYQLLEEVSAWMPRPEPYRRRDE